MLDEARSVAFVRAMLPLFQQSSVVLDALAMSVVRDALPLTQRVVMTPHAGEMAHLTGATKEAVLAQPLQAALEGARRWGACVALKGSTTFIAQPDGTALRFAGGTPGLATSGSGDTLAGLIGGLAARGAAPPARMRLGRLAARARGRCAGARPGKPGVPGARAVGRGAGTDPCADTPHGRCPAQALIRHRKKFEKRLQRLMDKRDKLLT